MTTSSDNLPKVKEDAPEKPEWVDDTFGETWVEREYGPNGPDSVYYYVIQDQSFEEAWIKSSESRNLAKMR